MDERNDSAPKQTEQTYVSGAFGTVTNKRVIYNRKKGWLSGGSREDIPLKHITSVQFAVRRPLLGGILLLLLGLSMLPAQTGDMKAIGVGMLAMAAFFLWGSPSVAVNTAGQDSSGAKGLPWQRKEAEEFVEAIRQHMARD